MCSGGMALPVSSFPNMNAISQEDPTGILWLNVSDFLKVGVLSAFFTYVVVNVVGFGIMTLLNFR